MISEKAHSHLAEMMKQVNQHYIDQVFDTFNVEINNTSLESDDPELFIVTLSSAHFCVFIDLKFDLKNEALYQLVSSHISQGSEDERLRNFYDIMQEHSNQLSGNVKKKLINVGAYCGLSTPHKMPTSCWDHLDEFSIINICNYTFSVDDAKVFDVGLSILPMKGFDENIDTAHLTENVHEEEGLELF